jgi:hypothetical protein
MKRISNKQVEVGTQVNNGGGNINEVDMGPFMVRVPALVEIWDFVTNEFATSCDYLTFTTTVGYIYNYCCI